MLSAVPTHRWGLLLRGPGFERPPSGGFARFGSSRVTFVAPCVGTFKSYMEAVFFCDHCNPIRRPANLCVRPAINP